MPKSEWPRRYRQYRVERLQRRDMGQIAQLERRVFLEPMSWGQIVIKYLSPRTIYLVVKDGPRIIAYFGFEVFGAYAHVLANVTDPDYRRQGLAAFLLTAAEPLAQARGAKAFLGEVRRSNTPQLRVLQSIGWQVVSEMPGFFGNGEDAYIVMKVFA